MYGLALAGVLALSFVLPRAVGAGGRALVRGIYESKGIDVNGASKSDAEAQKSANEAENDTADPATTAAPAKIRTATPSPTPTVAVKEANAGEIELYGVKLRLGMSYDDTKEATGLTGKISVNGDEAEDLTIPAKSYLYEPIYMTADIEGSDITAFSVNIANTAKKQKRLGACGVTGFTAAVGEGAEIYIEGLAATPDTPVDAFTSKYGEGEEVQNDYGADYVFTTAEGAEIKAGYADGALTYVAFKAADDGSLSEYSISNTASGETAAAAAEQSEGDGAE